MSTMAKFINTHTKSMTKKEFLGIMVIWCSKSSSLATLPWVSKNMQRKRKQQWKGFRFNKKWSVMVSGEENRVSNIFESLAFTHSTVQRFTVQGSKLRGHSTSWKGNLISLKSLSYKSDAFKCYWYVNPSKKFFVSCVKRATWTMKNEKWKKSLVSLQRLSYDKATWDGKKF